MTRQVGDEAYRVELRYWGAGYRLLLRVWKVTKLTDCGYWLTYDREVDLKPSTRYRTTDETGAWRPTKTRWWGGTSHAFAWSVSQAIESARLRAERHVQHSRRRANEAEERLRAIGGDPSTVHANFRLLE